MGLLQLLKTLSDQGSQANMQAQIDLLRDAIIDLKWTDIHIYATFGILILIFGTIGAVWLHTLDKRLKKVEEMMVLKPV